MTPDALREEHQTTKELWSKVGKTNLNSFHNSFLNLYQNVLDEYEFQFPTAKIDSEFYHSRKILQKMDDFSSLSAKKQEQEISDIRGDAGAALRDLFLLINKLK